VIGDWKEKRARSEWSDALRVKDEGRTIEGFELVVAVVPTAPPPVHVL
jgi:hypothetical protein